MKKCRHNQGFTLIELSIVMLIIGLLVAGLTQGLKIYYQKIAVEKTNDNIALVEQQLKKFVGTNKSYPCPGLNDTVTGTAAYGQSDCTGTTVIGTAPDQILTGMVPARALQLADSSVVDGWGKKLSYSVTKAMTVPGVITGDETLDPDPVIAVVDKDGTPYEVETGVPYRAPYVVISHGQDGKGAYTSHGVLSENCGTSALDGENCDNANITIRYQEPRSYTGDNNNFDDFVGMNLARGTTPTGDLCSLQSKFFVGIGVEGADENGCKAPAPKMQRIMFSTPGTYNWTVPKGVTSAFVSMAGGGGSGSGWRVSNVTYTGSSGGFVFSHPVNLIEGEVMTVVVGNGGVGHRPKNTGVAANPGPPYFIYAQPDSGDDGIAGHPGTSSKMVSPSAGVLLECTGGSGSGPNGLDTYSGLKVAGNVDGATWGGGNPPIPYPEINNRKAVGPHTLVTGPGSCGANEYGRGNQGMTTWADGATVRLTSGHYLGGVSPFKFGSGGNIAIQGCYITAAETGTCISPENGKGGVVMIDVLIYE